MNFLLEVTDYTKPIENTTDKFLFGGQMFLLGIATVFAVLVTIWLALVLFKLFFHDMSSKKEVKPEVASAPAQTMSAPAVAEGEEIIAVIAAAIAMAESENSGAKFRVVSFKRK